MASGKITYPLPRGFVVSFEEWPGAPRGDSYHNIRYYGINGYDGIHPKESNLDEVLTILLKNAEALLDENDRLKKSIEQLRQELGRC